MATVVIDPDPDSDPEPRLIRLGLHFYPDAIREGLESVPNLVKIGAINA